MNKEEYRKKIENVVLMDSTVGKVQAISKLSEEILEELFTTSDLKKDAYQGNNLVSLTTN